MITSIYLSLSAWFINLLAGMLPDWTISDEIVQSTTMAINNVYLYDDVLPIRLLFFGLIFIITFEIIILTIRGIFGLMSFVRGGGNIDL